MRLRKRLFFAAVTSFLLILSFPLPNLWPVAWVALVPLLFAVERAGGEREAFFLGWASGFLFYVISVAWLRHVTYFGWFFVSAVEGFYIGVFAWLAKALMIRRPAGSFGNALLAVFLLPAFWVALEWFRTEVPPLEFGWNLLAYSQASNVRIIQIARLVGAYGVSFLIVLVNVVFYVWARAASLGRSRSGKGDGLRRHNLLLICVFCFLVLAVVYGSIRIGQPFEGPIVRATVVQGNIAQEDKWKLYLKGKIVDVHTKLSELAVYDNTDLIIWPEAAYPGYLLEEKEGLIVSNTAAKTRVPHLVGSIYRDTEGRYFNSAFLISSEGYPIMRYDKRILVPFGEYVPLGCVFTFLKPIAASLGISDFSKGENWTVFRLKLGAPYGVSAPTFSTLICFEDTFPLLARRFVREGANFLVVITNDAWFKRGGEPYQHLQPSQFRAVENDVFVVRAANTGISCFISPTGRVIGRVRDKKGRDAFVSGKLTETVYVGNKPTFYQECGFLFPYFCIFSLIVYLAVLSFPRLLSLRGSR